MRVRRETHSQLIARVRASSNESYQLAVWSSAMILALGARGPGFNWTALSVLQGDSCLCKCVGCSFRRGHLLFRAGNKSWQSCGKARNARLHYELRNSRKSGHPESNQGPSDSCKFYSQMLYQLSYDRCDCHNTLRVFPDRSSSLRVSDNFLLWSNQRAWKWVSSTWLFA